MKKILIVTPQINKGGISAVVKNICVSLSNCYYIDIVAMEQPCEDVEDFYNQLNIGLIEIKRISESGIKSYKKQLSEILRKQKYDVIHIHNDWLAWVSAKTAKREGVKIRIGHAHGQCFGNGKNILINLLGGLCKRLNRKYCTHYVGCSLPSIKHMFGCEGMLLPNYIPYSQMKFLNEDDIVRLKKELNIPAKKIIIGYAGSLDGVKNTNFIFEIAKQAGEKYCFVLAGDSQDLNGKKEYLKHNNIDNVILLGYRHDISEIYNVFDMYINTSLSEGMSISIIQAQMMGIPTIVSNGVPEINDLRVGLFYKNSSYDTNEWIGKIKSINLEKLEKNKEILIEKISTSDKAEKYVVEKLKSIYNL